MARKPFKTFTTADAAKLKSLVSAFNSKITQVSKTPTLKEAQPQRIKYSEIIKTVNSRNELNRVYGVYSRYLKKGAERIYTNESGVRVTRWLRDETRYAVQRINAGRARQRKRFENLPGKLRAGAIEELNLETKRNNLKSITTKAYVDKMFRGLQRQAGFGYFAMGEESYKANYLKSLRNGLSGGPGFTKLYNMVKNLSGRTLLEAGASDPTFLIEFNYPIDGEDMRIEYLIEQWQDYLDDREYFAEM